MREPEVGDSGIRLIGGVNEDYEFCFGCLQVSPTVPARNFEGFDFVETV
jgi:hypothetical protein